MSVHLQSDRSDAYELDALTRQLRRELLSLDLDNVTLDREVEIPKDAKGEAIAIGTLVMTLANSAVLVAACQVIRAWVSRGQGRGATIRFGKESGQTLEIQGASKAQNQQIIDAFLMTMRLEVDHGVKMSDQVGRGGTGQDSERRSGGQLLSLKRTLLRHRLLQLTCRRRRQRILPISWVAAGDGRCCTNMNETWK